MVSILSNEKITPLKYRIQTLLSFLYIKELFDRYPMVLRECDTVEEQLNENRIDNLRDIRYLVSDEFKKDYKQSDIVLKYFDSLLKADEAKIKNKRSEVNSKSKFYSLLLSIRNFLIERDLL